MVSLRVFDSLHFKIASGVILSVVILSGIYFVWDYQFYRRQLLDELEASAIRISDVTLNSLLELGMLGNHPELLQRGVESLGSDPSVHRIAILDRSGLVHFSSRRDDLGAVFSIEGPGCRECHATEPATDRIALFESDTGPLLRNVSLVPNRSECHSCHNPAESTIGLLLVDFPTREIETKLAGNLSEMLVRAGLTLLSILLVLGVLMNRLVITRIKRLTNATRRFTSRGEGPDLREQEGPDEIGQLAQAFNRMTAELRRYCRDLEEKEETRRSLLDRVVRTQEEERKTISRELHDRLGQDLSALLLTFQTSCSTFPGSAEACLVSDRARLEEMIGDLIGKVRRLAWEMRPSILDDYGLEAALSRYVEEVGRTTSLAIDFHGGSPPDLGRLPSWVEVTLYRVTQEALNNVARHSRASRVGVVLLRQREAVTLLVEDDGRGFDPAGVNSDTGGGLGLTGMRERITLCGGSFAVESSHGAGTTIRVRIPLDGGGK